MSIFHSNRARKQKRKIHTFAYYLHLANFFVGIGFLLLIAWYAAFLYQHFYQAVVESEIIVVLRQQVSVTQINYPKFLEVLSKIKEKRALPPIDTANLPNPFLKLPEPGAVPSPIRP